MKNKLVIVTSENFPYGGPGANYLRNLSLGLKFNSNYIVELWLQSGNSRSYEGFQNKKESSIKGINYFFVCGYAKRPRKVFGKIVDDFLGFFIPIIKIIKEREQIKNLIVYDNFSFITAIPLFLCKILRIRIIKIIPEWLEKSAIITSKIKYLNYWDFIIGMKKVNFHFDGLIVCSSFLKNYYVSNGFPSEKILILPNLVNIEEFSNVGTKKSTNLITIGYSGTPVRKDGILDLLKAFSLLVKKYRNLELLIIGDISQTKTAIPFLKEQAAELGIKEAQLYFTGLVDFKEIPVLLNRCDILTLARPSGLFAEAGFPTKLGEYLACQKPIVLTRVGDMPKYFLDKCNVVFAEPDNPESIRNGIEYLIENPQEASAIARKGYEWVLHNLEYKSVTEKTINFIESI